MFFCLSTLCIVLMSCTFRANSILEWIWFDLFPYYYNTYFIVMTLSVLYVCYTWQILYPPRWISGILNEWMNESACLQQLFGLHNYIYLLTAFIYFFVLLFAHLHVYLKFRMFGALYLLPQYAFMVCARAILTLYNLNLYIYLYLYFSPYPCLYL